MLKPRGIGRPDGVPVRTVGVVHVQVIALEAPRLAEHLAPLRARIHSDPDGGGDLTVTRILRTGIGVHDPPLRPHAIEELLAILRDGRALDPLHEDLGLPLLQIVAMQPEPRLVCDVLSVEEDAFRPRHDAQVVLERDVERQNALIDSVEIDADRRLLGLLFFLFFFPLLRLLLVALGQERRRLIGREHGQVDASLDGPFVRRHVQPSHVQPVVRAGHEEEVLAALVPRR